MNSLSKGIAQLSAEKRNALESQLLARISANQKKPPLPKSAGAVSFAQESLWFLDQLKPNSPLYNIAQAFRLNGPLDASVLGKAFEKVVQRHELLRASFSAVDGKPAQTIRTNLSFELQKVDLRDHEQGDAEARRLLQVEVERPFDIANDLLIRALLIQVSAEENYLLIVLHHIVADFSSLLVLYRELADSYYAFSTGTETAVPVLKMQFPEWAALQRERLHGDTWNRKLDYWKQKLQGELPNLELPTDRPRSAQQQFRGARCDLQLSSELLIQLKELSRREGTTLYLTLLTAFGVLLGRYSGQKEVIIGSPIDQRNTTDAEQLIGYFINTLPLRLNFSGSPTFIEVLREVRSVALEAFVNQEMPFEKIVEALQLPRTTDRNPLFQSVFQYLPTLPLLAFPGISSTALPVHTGTAKFDITFTVAESSHGLSGEIEYNADLFDAATIERMATHYEVLLNSIVTAPREKISALAILLEAEQRQIVLEWNQTETKYPRHACVHELFEDQVNRSPNAMAIKFQEETLTYYELNTRANQLAHRLQTLGVGPDVLVGLALERSLDLVVALLAILKAGGAYVPLDPAYPRERLNYIINDTAISLLVTTRSFQDLGAGISKKVLIDEEGEILAGQEKTNPISHTTPENLAYVMYTSGSTGKAKGVLIPHRGIVRLVKETNYVSFSPSDVFLQFAPISFDASTFEIWGALLNGARLLIYPPHMTSLEEFGSFVLREGVTTLWLTAGLFHQMIDGHVQQLQGLKNLLAGGDILSVPHVLKAQRELPHCQIVNGYGPTEGTTFTCCYTVPGGWDGTSLPIGKPISNTQVYVLDENLKTAPIGVAGELYIGGDGLAREYLNAPELNAQKFVSDPFRANAKTRIYRSGDLVRWLANGTIEFLGRMDNQVKVRGFRVEPGEVENVLAQHPEIKEAAVVARQTSVGKELVAYVVPKENGATDIKALRQFLQKTLPPYMVPTHFIALEKFPLTTNGKIDRHKLPSPAETIAATEVKLVEPRNATEQRLREIWMEVLGRKQVGVEDDFFALGGHSLMATQIISRASRAFGQEVPLRLLFEYPTIASFGKAILRQRGAATSDQSPIVKRTRGDAVRLDQLSDTEIDALFQASHLTSQ